MTNNSQEPNYGSLGTQERQAKAAAQKADFQLQMGALTDKIRQEEHKKEDLIQEKRVIESEVWFRYRVVLKKGSESLDQLF